MSAMRRTLLTVVIGLAGLVASATPATAHSVDGISATNFQTRLLDVEPAVEGLSMRIVESGSRFELSNTTAHEVLVLGYQDEPYLRVGPTGVFENRRSPAAYLNASRRAETSVPGSADPKAAPQWRKVSSDHVARWHDHRIHWMGAEDPRSVRDDPDRVHVVIPEWKIQMRWNAKGVVASGDLRWVPGPSPVPWLALMPILFLAVAASGLLSSASRVLAPIAAVVVVGDVVHAIGVAGVRAGPLVTKVAALLAGSFYSVLAWIAGIMAIRWLRMGRPEGFVAAGLAGVWVALFGGLADVADLSRSQVPFTWGAGLARPLVTVSIGAGLGLAAAAVIAVRRQRPTEATAGDGGEAAAHDEDELHDGPA